MSIGWLLHRARVGGLAGALVGCGNVASDPDASANVDTSVEPFDSSPPSKCQPTQSWGTPHLLANINSLQLDSSPTLARDELTIYFDSDRPQDMPSGGGREIWMAQRSDRAATFGTAVLVSAVNVTPGYDADPMISGDNLSLVLARSEPGGARSVGLWIATRPNSAAAFSAPVVIANVNSDAWDSSGYVSTVSNELIFRSDRGTQPDLYRSTGTYAQGFATATPIIELNTPAFEVAPVLSDDGLTLLFASTRTDGGAIGGLDVWMTTRATLQAAFGPPLNVTELNTALNDTPGWLSADGCRLYFESDRGGHYDLYVVDRPAM